VVPVVPVELVGVVPAGVLVEVVPVFIVPFVVVVGGTVVVAPLGFVVGVV